jgi:hypothetical protein
MSLRARQSEFARHVALLIERATTLGYEVTLGEAYRPPETAALYARQGRGIVASQHCQKLAIDLNLFRDGVYLTTAEAHRPLGEWWERLGPGHRWGGNFERKDGNHYELQP